METSHTTRINMLLRQERIRRNWRQRDLAEQLGTTVLTIKRWERGSQQPGPYFCIKLCTLFGKSPEELGLDCPTSSGPMKRDAGQTPPPASSSAEEPLALWTVPYLRNPHFTGRDELLAHIDQLLSLQKQPDPLKTRRAALSQPQAVKGLGGIGKTQVALEYAYRSREQGAYTHILWFNAASEEALSTSFLALAARLPSLAERNTQDQRQLVAAIKTWLEQCQGSWLLIFDNADDLSLVQPYMPQQGHGSVLLTTRATAVRWLANSIEVEQMGVLEGAQFLLHRTQRLQANDEEYNQAANVVIALDGFPLALDQAGAYIEETGCDFDDYLRLYQHHRSKLLARRGAQATHYPDSVATTWSLSFQKIEQAHPAAALLLQLCAYLSPDHIPEELLTDGAASWPPILQQAVANPFRLNELLEALLAFSLVKRFAQEHVLSIHRLVQAVQLDRTSSQEQRRWAERVVCAVNALFPLNPAEAVETWPRCQRYLEQVQACDTLIQQHSLQLPEAAQLLNRAGVYLRDHASYSLAESLFLRALAIAEQQSEPEQLQVAPLLDNLGILYFLQDMYEQAIACSQRSLHIWEQTLGPEHLNVALPLTTLGNTFYQQGLYEQAEPLLQRALHIWEQALGPNDSHVAGALTNLGTLYAQQGLLEQAKPLFQRALDIREQILGPHHPHLIMPLNNLGTICYEQGLYEQAEMLLQRSILIGEEAFGPEHPQVAMPLHNLGLLYSEQGQYEQAEAMLRRVVHIREQVLGPHQFNLAEPLNELANISRAQGLYEQADALYQRALSLRQAFLGPQHPAIAETLQGLARLRQLQQQPAEALLLSRQALTLLEEHHGPEHPRTLKAREALLEFEFLRDAQRDC